MSVAPAEAPGDAFGGKLAIDPGEDALVDQLRDVLHEREYPVDHVDIGAIQTGDRVTVDGDRGEVGGYRPGGD